MEIKQFIKMLNNNNAIRLTDDYILFNDLELYNFETEKSIQFNNFQELFSYNLLGNTIKHLIENTEDFYYTFDGGGFNHATDRGAGQQNTKFESKFNVGGKKVYKNI